MRFTKRVLAALVVLATLVFGGTWAFQSHGIYHSLPAIETPGQFGLSGVRIETLVSEDGAPIQVWIADPGGDRPVIVSFLGNASTAGPNMRRLWPLVAAGYGLVIMEYRGSGATPGTPGEAAFAGDARALYDGLDGLLGRTVPPGQRILHGFSLGSGVAVRLASERAFAAVVLEGALDRMCRYTVIAPAVSLCPFMWRERYDNASRIGAVTAPKLFVHGDADRIVPLAWAQALFDAAPAPKTFVLLKGGSHVNLAKFGLFPAVLDFLRANGL